ncbi:MAG: adenylate/guanylate cyclase domain-containing protein, partial [Chloroflexota bacterium]|nr:adenylate/guanylate cyclase domain-containing protein [Chloroflexota bacterium]
MGFATWRDIPLPSGTVTFLFTDIAGSTRLWEQEPVAMRRATTRHDALVEQVIAQHDGVLVRPRGEGDSRFAVFQHATEAVRAASALQQALFAEPWPTTTPLRVRMALHTGEAELRVGDYYGSDVNRCARLRSLAHPGQTLLSLTTVRLASDTLPEGASLRDLGQHRLKDLTQPEQIFQLVVPGLPADFPPLQSLGARPHNLPTLPTPLIGREQELATLVELLERETVRLVTVTGPGGMGKTRISLQVAAELLDDFPDGV